MKKNKKQQPKLKIEYRNHLYYGIYHHKVVIPIPDIYRFRYYESYHDYITYTTYSYWGSYGQKNKELANKDEIERYYSWKNSVPDTVDYKLRLEGAKISVFSDDVGFLESAVKKIDPEDKNVTYYEVNAPEESDIMYFTNEPKHKFRIYFKSILIDKITREAIQRFINDNTDNGVEVCGTMKKWLLQGPVFRSDGSSYLREGFHIDYDDESYEMAIRLLFGENLKPKVNRLLQRPK